MRLVNSKCTVSGVAGRGDGGRFSFYLRKEAINMKCHRCGGVMVFEKFYSVCEHFSGWRCILCGEIVDPVIFENRLNQRR